MRYRAGIALKPSWGCSLHPTSLCHISSSTHPSKQHNLIGHNPFETTHFATHESPGCLNLRRRVLSQSLWLGSWMELAYSSTHRFRHLFEPYGSPQIKSSCYKIQSDALPWPRGNPWVAKKHGEIHALIPTFWPSMVICAGSWGFAASFSW